MLLSEALLLVGAQGGFDSSVAQTDDQKQRSWISTAVQEAVAYAKSLKQIRSLGPTVAGTSDYIVDTDILQVRSVRVNGSRPWARARLEDVWFAEADPSAAALVGGAPGAFAPSWETEAAQDTQDVPTFIRLWPKPTVSGYTIEALCAVSHQRITDVTSTGYAIQVPEDLARKIVVDGAVALGIMYVHERADLAAPYLARYQDGKEQLKARASSRIGHGVIYPPVARRRG